MLSLLKIKSAAGVLGFSVSFIALDISLLDGYNKIMAVTGHDEAMMAWGDAMQAVLRKARVPDAELARKAGYSRMAISRYFRGRRRLGTAEILRLNRLTKELVSGRAGIPGNVGVRAYLDVVAALSGLLTSRSFATEHSLSLDAVLDKATETLRVMGAGVLRSDWYERLMRAAESEGDAPRRFSHFIVELNRQHGRLLLSAIDGRVPAQTGYDVLRKVLAAHDLSDLISDDIKPASNFETLTFEVRAAVAQIAKDDATALERFEVENKLLVSAVAFARSATPQRNAYQAAIAEMMATLGGKSKKGS